jgi:multiple sugar transport system substrate-binding protein
MADDKLFASEETPKKILGAFLLVGLLVLGLAVFAPNPGARKYPGRKPVLFWHMWTADWEKVVGRICDRFNESQDVYEVIPLTVPGDQADSKFLISVAAGNSPDCMAEWNDVIPKWAESKLLMPLDKMMGPVEWAKQKKSIYPAALRVGMYKDSLYGLAVGMNVWALYYRPDLMREAGLDPDHLPDSLEGLEGWAARLNKKDADGGLVRIGLLPWGLRNFAPLFGSGFWDWDKGQLTLDTPSNLAALEYLTKVRADLGFDNVVRFEAGLQGGTSGMNASWPLLTGSYAMVIDGQWRVQDAEKNAPKGFEFKTAPIPAPIGGKKGGGFCNGNFMVIPSTSKDPEGAWAFMKFWSGLDKPERAAEFYTWGGWLPLNKEVADSPIYRGYVHEHPQFRTFVDLLSSPNLSPIPPVPYQVFLSDRLQDAEQSIGLGHVTPRQAMDKLVQEVDRELAHRKEYGYVD